MCSQCEHTPRGQRSRWSTSSLLLFPAARSVVPLQNQWTPTDPVSICSEPPSDPAARPPGSSADSSDSRDRIRHGARRASPGCLPRTPARLRTKPTRTHLKLTLVVCSNTEGATFSLVPSEPFIWRRRFTLCEETHRPSKCLEAIATSTDFKGEGFIIIIIITTTSTPLNLCTDTGSVQILRTSSWSVL